MFLDVLEIDSSYLMQFTHIHTDVNLVKALTIVLFPAFSNLFLPRFKIQPDLCVEPELKELSGAGKNEVFGAEPQSGCVREGRWRVERFYFSGAHVG